MDELVKVLWLYVFCSPFALLGLFLIIFVSIFGKKIIGWFGEHWTRNALKDLPKDKYILINDVFIITNGISHQIDHVIVSPYGIFSIETKQYNGFITGNKYDKYWVRHQKKKKYYYYNPIRQNYGHVKALSELLNIDESKIYNVVCIPSNAELRIEHDGELVRYGSIMNKIISYQDIVIDNVDEIVDIINKNNIKDNKIRKEHYKNIKKNIVDKDLNKCPKCGGDLILRKGEYGQFYGCSNYPKCRYVRK